MDIIYIESVDLHAWFIVEACVRVNKFCVLLQIHAKTMGMDEIACRQEEVVHAD